MASIFEKKISCKGFNLDVRLLNGHVAAATALTEIELIGRTEYSSSPCAPPSRSIYLIGILSSPLSLTYYVQSLPGVTGVFSNISPRRSLIHPMRDFVGFYDIFAAAEGLVWVGGSSRRGGSIRSGESGCGSWHQQPVRRWGVEGVVGGWRRKGCGARERSRGRRGGVIGMVGKGGEGRGEWGGEHGDGHGDGGVR